MCGIVYKQAVTRDSQSTTFIQKYATVSSSEITIDSKEAVRTGQSLTQRVIIAHWIDTWHLSIILQVHKIVFLFLLSVNCSPSSIVDL